MASIVLKRILELNGQAVCYEEIRLPAPLFKGLTAAVVLEHECMLYSMYETRFGVRVLQAEERVKAVEAPREASAALDLAADAPVLQIERVAFTYGRQPTELRTQLLRHTRRITIGTRPPAESMRESKLACKR